MSFVQLAVPARFDMAKVTVLKALDILKVCVLDVETADVFLDWIMRYGKDPHEKLDVVMALAQVVAATELFFFKELFQRRLKATALVLMGHRDATVEKTASQHATEVGQALLAERRAELAAAKAQT